MMEGSTGALLNTCEESRQTKGIVWVLMKADRWTRCQTMRNLTFRSRLRSSVTIPNEPPRELEESIRGDLEIGMDAGRVVYLSVRKILKKLKSICSVSRLCVVSWEGTGETRVIDPRPGQGLVH